jgi:hypothetical protein
MAKTRQEIAAIIEKYRDALSMLGVRTERVILYGSYAADRAKDESDIDLVIVSPDFEDKDVRERLELLGIASARIMEPVQALGVTPAEIESEEKSAFIREVLKHGKVAA